VTDPAAGPVQHARAARSAAPPFPHPEPRLGRTSDDVTRVIDRPVLVLNRGWEPVGVFDVATAITTVIRDMGWVLDPGTWQLHAFEAWRALDLPAAHVIRTPSGGVPAPEIIVLREYGDRPRPSAAFSRRSLYRRDGHRCQFCGRALTAEEGTIDHVVPRSRGGRTTWENCVLACAPCNRRKADRTPAEAGMRLLTTPRRPRLRRRIAVPRDAYRESWDVFVRKADVEIVAR